MFVPEDTECRFYPMEEAPVCKTASNYLAEVYVSVYQGDVSFSLAYIPSCDNLADALCWVRTEELMEYHPEQMQEKLYYPIRIKKDSVYEDTVFHEKYSFSTDYSIYLIEDKDDVVIVTDTGGRTYEIPKSDILYPTVRDNNICWDKQ